MKATKFKLTINTETLSIDSILALLTKLQNTFDEEIPNGKLTYSDGDMIVWELKTEEVEF